jgi:GntR family transcriptional repressor for pyruvate dehydrogenase complex
MVHDARPGATPSGLSKVRRPRLYEQIAEQIMSHVEQASLQPGDRLPPERELAAALGVSRASVSQALVALEVVGTVTVRHGDGAILAQRPGGSPVSTLIARHTDQLPDVLEARATLEVSLAGLAARRRTEADLAEIDASLEQMASDVADGGRGVEADERFHAAVTAAAHSSVLASLMGQIGDLVRESRIESLSQPERPTASLRGHRAVADAIRAWDPTAARAAMEEHIRLVSDVAVLDAR